MMSSFTGWIEMKKPARMRFTTEGRPMRVPRRFAAREIRIIPKSRVRISMFFGVWGGGFLGCGYSPRRRWDSVMSHLGFWVRGSFGRVFISLAAIWITACLGSPTSDLFRISWAFW